MPLLVHHCLLLSFWPRVAKAAIAVGGKVVATSTDAHATSKPHGLEWCLTSRPATASLTKLSSRLSTLSGPSMSWPAPRSCGSGQVTLRSECQDWPCVLSQLTTTLEIRRHWQHGSWVRWVCTLAEHGITPLSDQARHDQILRELACWGGSPRHSGRADWACSLAPQLLVSWVPGQGCNVFDDGSFAWYIQCSRSAMTWTPSQGRWIDEWGYDWERSVQGKDIAGKVSMRGGCCGAHSRRSRPKEAKPRWVDWAVYNDYYRVCSGWPDIVLSRAWCHRVWLQKGCVISQSSMAVLNP